MTNRYNIISSDSKKSKELIKIFNGIVDQKKWVFDSCDYQYLFIFGGDGTFLKNTSKLINKKIKIIVINGGTFGFYSFFSKKNIEKLFDDIENEKHYINPLMLQLSTTNKKVHCLNEIVLVSNHLLNLDIYIDNIKYEKFKGTGLLFSTPTGTTGRNRSAHGSVILPNNDVYQMVEIEAISQKKYNTLNSPIILGSKNTFQISVNQFIDYYYLLVDGIRYEFDKKQEFVIKSFKPKLKLYYPSGLESYINKLREKFITTE